MAIRPYDNYKDEDEYVASLDPYEAQQYYREKKQAKDIERSNKRAGATGSWDEPSPAVPGVPAIKPVKAPVASLSAKAPSAAPAGVKPAPIPPEVLKELEATEPELVARYKAKMGLADAGVAEAKRRQDLGTYGNIAAGALTDFNNSQKKDIMLKSRMEDLGKAPQMVRADRTPYDGSAVDKLGQREVDRANQAKKDAEDGFWNEEKLTDRAESKAEIAALKDPKSPESIAAQNSLAMVAPKFAAGKDLSQFSAAQIKDFAPQAFQMSQAQITREFESSEKAKDRNAKTGAGKSLNTTEQQRYDNAAMGLVAVRGMTSALRNGDNTFNPVGDNDFMMNRRNFEEALGRMQSGGAITNDEAVRFQKMAPKFTDSAEMQQKKLRQLEAEMTARITSLGKDPDSAVRDRNGGNAVDPADQQAYDWAQANPSDPRSKQIIERLRKKYGQ